MSSTVIAMAIKEHRRSPQANIYVMEILPSPAEHIPEVLCAGLLPAAATRLVDAVQLQCIIFDNHAVALWCILVQTEVSGWTVHTGKHGLYYLHEASGLTFQTLVAAKVAVYAFSHTTASDKDDDDEREEGSQHRTCLDAMVSHLHRHIDSLHAYNRGIAQKDMQGALNEEGEAIEDGFVVVEAPG
ncbi:TPA: hypothetical protein ACH3X1_004180 [Trebouxia sp. C0004]